MRRESEIPSAGFKPEQIEAFDSYINPRLDEKNKTKEKDSDSSSFLRMMMD